MLTILTLLVSVDPNLVSKVDGTGALPLHIVCHNRDAPIDVIQFLVEQDPATLRREDKQGNLPIHSLCASQPLLDTVKYLHSKHEPFITALNNHGHSPFMVASLESASIDVLWYLMVFNPDVALAHLCRSS